MAEQTKQLIVTYESNHSPLAYLDDTGQPTGYLVDYWNAFGQANDVEILFDLTTWDQTLNKVRMGEADVHGGLFQTPGRERFLDYGPTLFEMSTDVYARSDLTSEEADTLPVGVVRADASEEYMREKHPNRELVLFDTFQTLIQAAGDNAIDVFITDRPMALHFLRQLGLADAFRLHSELYTLPLKCAVAKGNTDTLRLLETGVDRIDEKTRESIRKRWFIEPVHESGWFPPGLLAMGFVLVAAVLFRRYS